MNPDGIKNTISKKIKDEKDMVRRLGNKDFKVSRISLPIDKVYYNLLNRRTNGNIKDYCKKKNLGADYFSEDNLFNPDVQQEYHSIIYEKHAVNKEKEYKNKFIDNQESQTEELWINNEGVLMNGNTRISWWRENEIFNDVEFLVFIEDYELRDLLAAVNYIDSPEDISQNYVWHSTPTQVRSWIGDHLYSEEEFKKYAADSNVTPKELNNLMHMSDIAEEFLNAGFKEYEYFDDLEKIGEDHGGLTFRKIAEGIDRADQLNAPIELTNQLKRASWKAITDRSKSIDEYDNAYRAIEGFWRKEHIIESMYEYNDTESSGGLIPKPSTEPKKPKKKTQKKETDDEIYKRIAKKSKLVKEKINIKGKTEAFAIKITKAAEDIETAIENFLHQDTDLPKTRKAQKKLESAVKKLDETLDKVFSNES